MNCPHCKANITFDYDVRKNFDHNTYFCPLCGSYIIPIYYNLSLEEKNHKKDYINADYDDEDDKDDEDYDDRYNDGYEDEEGFKEMIWWVIKDLSLRLSIGFVIAFYILPILLSYF